MTEDACRILIVDDSPVVAESLRMIFEDAGLTVVGVASDGRMGVRLTQELRPDLITMDIEMPSMGGLEAIEEIMGTTPTPILVVTSLSRSDPKLPFEALRRGALDLIHKPLNWPPEPDELEKMTGLIRRLARTPVVYHARKRTSQASRGAGVISRDPVQPRLVCLVGSTGAPRILADILRDLPADFPVPLAVVQHTDERFVKDLAEWLDSVTELRVCVAETGSIPAPGRVYIAPAGRHLRVRSGPEFFCSFESDTSGHMPSGTALFESAAKALGQRVVGVVLSGMGSDGADGAAAIDAEGGRVLVQAPETCVVDSMPSAARDRARQSRVVDPSGISSALRRLTFRGGR